MPVWVARTVARWTVRSAPVCHDGRCMPPHTSGRAVPRHVPLGDPQSDAWAGELERGPEVVSCRGKWLAATAVLPRLRACRSPGLAGAHGAPRRASLGVPGLGLPGGLLPPGPWCSGSVVPASSSCRGLASLARQAPLAGALSSCLECLVLARPQKEGPLRLLALPWRALPQGATTARAQVRGTKVPLL